METCLHNGVKLWPFVHKASIQFHSNVTYKLTLLLTCIQSMPHNYAHQLLWFCDNNCHTHESKLVSLQCHLQHLDGCRSSIPSNRCYISGLVDIQSPVVFLLGLENDTILFWDCCHILSSALGSGRFYPMHWDWCSSHIQEQLQKENIRFSQLYRGGYFKERSVKTLTNPSRHKEYERIISQEMWPASRFTFQSDL